LSSIQARVVDSTQRSITPARPLFSAAAISGPAGDTRPSASRMRSSTSKFSDSYGAVSDMIGCISRNMPSVAFGPDRRATRFSSASRSWKAFEPRSYTTRPSLVAALGLAAGAVGGRDGILHRHARRHFDQADRAAHVEGLVADAVRRAADAVDDAAADQRRQRDRRVRHDDDEFVAAHAADLLAAGQHQFHAFAHLLQHFVAGAWPNRSLISLKRSRSM
jgi:hypothetical protein